MKRITFATALLAATLAGGPSFALAQSDKGMSNIMAMDKDKDGMISRTEFMDMMGREFDKMDKDKKGRISAADVQKSIDAIFKTYGANP
jgi:Ca2+-binding EF-hand superfamily protein